MSGIRIVGTGRYVPENVVTNQDFVTLVDTSDEWIVTRTGMSRRHVAKDEPCWYLGAMAAKAALENAGLQASDVDMILCTTVTPDYAFPSNAALIQRFLAADNAFSLDISVACSGYAYSLDMARRYLCTGDVSRVLVVGAENLTRYVDYRDRATCVLFGDGAGACVVERGDGVYGTYLRTDPTGAHQIYSKHPRQALPFFDSGAPSGQHDPFPDQAGGYIYMNGREIYKFAIKAMPEAVEKACAKAGIEITQLGLIFPHQANLRILETSARNLGLPMEKFYINIHEYANTSSATIAIGLDECARAGRLTRGELLCVVGFGAGLTYGATVFEW